MIIVSQSHSSWPNATKIRKGARKPGFYYAPKRIQSDHVENQVHGVAVQKATGEPSVMFAVTDFLVGPVFQLVGPIGVVERHNGYQTGEGYDQVVDFEDVVHRRV